MPSYAIPDKVPRKCDKSSSGNDPIRSDFGLRSMILGRAKALNRLTFAFCFPVAEGSTSILSNFVSERQTTGLEVVMWMNQPSPHQQHLSSELLHRGANLTVVYVSRLRQERKEIGWEVDADNGPQTNFLTTRYSLWQALRLLLRYRQSIHVVNGIWAEPALFVVLAFACLLKVPCCIYSEAPASMVLPTWTSYLKRPLQYLIVRLLQKRVAGLLAISWLAERAFAALGFPESKMYRFGYFEKMPANKLDEAIPAALTTDIVYVGRLARGKGIELLIEAAAPLLRDDCQLRLRIVGGGALEPELRRLVSAFGLELQVVFTGVVPSRSVPGLLQGVLMLVLPSEADGWGIVVNQALQAGTPVIVSDSCGAAELVANGVDGYVFRTGDAQNLSACMRAIIDNSHPLRMRAMAEEAGLAASAERTAPYLLHCLEHMTGLRSDRPAPQWILNHDPQPAQLSQDESVQEPRFAH